MTQDSSKELIIETIRTGEVFEVLETSWDISEVPFLLGPPGIGKSEIVYQFAKKKAKELGREFVDLFEIEDINEIINNPGKYFVYVDLKLQKLQPHEVYGLLDISEGCVKVIPYEWMKCFYDKNSCGILFLDELNLAHPQTLAAALELIHQKIIANKKIKGKVMIVAAGNPPTDNSLARYLPDAIIDRMGIYYIKEDLNDWTKWAIYNDIHPSIIEFLRIYPDMLYYKDSTTMGEGLSPFTTPRSWKKVSDVLWYLEKKYKDKKDFIRVLRKYLYAYLHKITASRFEGFLRQYYSENKIDVQDYIKNPYSLISVKNPETIYMIINNIASLYVNNKVSENKLVEIINILKSIVKEYAVYMVMRIWNLYKIYYKDENEARNLQGKLLDLLRDRIPDVYNIILEIFP